MPFNGNEWDHVKPAVKAGNFAGVIPKSPLQIRFKQRVLTRAIFVHAADTPPTMDIGWKEIHQWHTRDNGWSAIGYHVVIRRDGTIEAGRPLEAIGAHVAARNSDSVGVCMIGGKGKFSGMSPEAHYTKEQLASLLVVIKELREKYPEAEVLGHRDSDPGKQCPSFDVKNWYKTLQS